MNEISKIGITMEQAEQIVFKLNTRALKDFREFVEPKTFAVMDGQEVVPYGDFVFFLSLMQKPQVAGVVYQQNNRF
jgi:hypothetical protein